MEYREFKGGAKLSLLGFGAMRLPTGADGAIDERLALEMIDAAYRGGVNYYDSAYLYHGGASESFLGRALASYPRESFHLATKLPMWSLQSAEEALAIFEKQLARCQTGYFDFYLFHALNAAHFETIKRLGLYELFRQKQREGAIRHLGFSFHDKPEVLETIAGAYSWDFAQIQLNYLDWDTGEAKLCYETLESRGIPCVVMEPVRGSRLANLGPEANAVLEAAAPGRSIASWAMRFVGALPNVACVLSGMSTLPQVEDNLATFGRLEPLTEAEKEALAKAVAIFREVSVVPCTACRYCMPCPQGVDVPGVLALYNACAFDGDGFNLRQKYKAFPEEGRASHCVACGKCEEVCPQHLAIVKTLRRVESLAAEA